MDPATLLGALLLLVLLVAGAFFVIGGGKTGRTVLLVGPSGAGKTSLFHKLRDGDTHSGTVTSMEINDDTFPLSSEKGMNARPMRVVDLPGQPRLRLKLSQNVSGVRGVVFMVDSADFMPHIRDTAEYLYEVLSAPALARGRVPVLLACNKSDLGAKAHTIEFIRKKLEKEVESLRSTRGALEGGSDHQISLVNPSEPFSFANCRSNITTVSVSVMSGEVGAVESFLRSRVPA